jgi:hypothetical protein
MHREDEEVAAHGETKRRVGVIPLGGMDQPQFRPSALLLEIKGAGISGKIN